MRPVPPGEHRSGGRVQGGGMIPTFWLVLLSSLITGVVGVVAGYFLGRARGK